MSVRNPGLRLPSLTVAVGCLIAVACPAGALADVAPTGIVTADPPIQRTGHEPTATAPAAPKGVLIDRPTVPLDQYLANKRGPGSAPAGARRPGSVSAPNTINSIGGFDGDTEGGPGGGGAPPDINGAVSSTQNVEVTNSDVTVYAKSVSPGAPLQKVGLNAIAGYSATQLFDPRILYDSYWKRWVIQAEAFPENTTTQYQFIMISRTADATAGWIVYRINVTPRCGTGGFWDYPQLGMTQDAVMLTANCFTSTNAYGGARAFAVAKARLYNSQGFNVPVFSFANTTTAPLVLDDNVRAHLLITSSSVSQATWYNPGNAFYSTMGATVAITGWYTRTTPRSAGQKGCTTTSCNLDTGDGRFEAPSTQYGDSLWNVAVFGLGANGGFATPTWGQFDVEGTNYNTTKQSGQRFASGCSDDYHASIVASTAGRAWLNWATSDPDSCGGGTFIGGRIASRNAADPLGSLPDLATSDTSATTLTADFDPNFGVQRFGDTSSISLDPSDALSAWSWQERVETNAGWGTHSTKTTLAP